MSIKNNSNIENNYSLYPIKIDGPVPSSEYIAITKGKDIKSYEHAISILQRNVNPNATASEKVLAIVEAANFVDNGNKPWKANFSNNDYNYLPYFEKVGSVWSLSRVLRYISVTLCPVGFYYKNRDTAEVLVKKFIGEYNEWLG